MNNQTKGWNRIKLSDWSDEGLKNLKKTAEILKNKDGTMYTTPSGRYAFWRSTDTQVSPVRIVDKPVAKVVTAEPVKVKPRKKISLAQHIVKGLVVAMVAWMLMIVILAYIEQTKASPKGYYWPIVPNNVAEVAYASGLAERDLPPLTPNFEKGQDNGATFRGKASYYSMDGCLGCKPYYDENGVYYLTANGDRFDENAHTLAVPAEWVKEGKVELGTIVSVTNLDNGKRVLGAVVNDSGGFLKYGRIADLSKALYEELGVITDVTTIEVQVLPTLDMVQ